MADFLPADHFKEEVSSRKHTKGPSRKDADWDFLKGAGPSAPDPGGLTTTTRAEFKPGWKEIRHEDKIQPSKERMAYERIQEEKHDIHQEQRRRFLSNKAQYNGFNPVTGEDYRPPVHHAHHIVSNPNVAADHDPLLQYGNASPDRSTIMTWKHSRPTPAEADVQARRDAQAGHIQDMRQGRIKSEGLAHTKSTSVGDLI